MLTPSAFIAAPEVPDPGDRLDSGACMRRREPAMPLRARDFRENRHVEAMLSCVFIGLADLPAPPAI